MVNQYMMLPPTGTKRLWLLPSNKARSTIIVCRTILILCIAILLQQHHFSTTNNKDNSNVPSSTSMTTTTTITMIIFVFVLGILIGCQGPRWSIVYRIFGDCIVPIKIFYRQTHVKPGYESIVKAFESTLIEGRETSIQFSVYIKNELVIDLAGSTVQKQKQQNNSIENRIIDYDSEQQLIFDSDTYSTVWSCSKVVTSIIIAWLVDQGYLDYKNKIRDYWPEFTGHGKENITLEELLHHHAGLSKAKRQVLTLQDLYPENLHKGNVSKMFEEMKCRFPPTWSKAMLYHGLTRGWILNEIVQRVDPKKRTIGTILREEFTQPLNIDKECYLGLPEHLCNAKTNPKLRLNDPLPSYFWVLMNKLCQLFHIPTTTEWKFNILFTTVVTYFTLNWKWADEFVNPHCYNAFHFCNQEEYRRGETPSANIQSSARALATIANAMATHDPKIFRSNRKSKNNNNKDSTILDKMAQNEQTRYLMPFNKSTFNDGGFCVISCGSDDNDNDNSVKTHIPHVPGVPYAWGWFGFNGSLMIFHPKGDFALAFQPTACNELNPSCRVEKMTRALMECARQIHGDDFGKQDE